MSAIKVDHWAADKAARTSFINTFLAKTTPRVLTELYSPNEEAIMTRIELSLLSTSKDDEILDDSLFFTKRLNIKNAIGIGTCTGIVQASPEELLAYSFLSTTHEARKAHIAANGPDSSKYPNKTIRVVNDHHQIFYSCRKLPPPMKPREWLTRNIFQRVDADTIKYFSTSIHDDPDLPPSFTKTTLHNAIRGEISVIHEYKRLPHNQTRFTLRLKVDIKGSIPQKIANMGMSSALDSVYRAYKYFQRDEEIDELEVSLLR